MLTRAEVKGFKCLHDVSVELGPFNVLIGSNDSGKSSFLQALRWPNSIRAGRGGVPFEAHDVRVTLMSGSNRLALSESADALELKFNDVSAEAVDFLRTSLARLPEAARDFVRITEPIMFEPTAISSPSPKGTGRLNDLIASRGRGAAAHLAKSALGDRERYEAIQKGMRDITGGRVREVVVGEDNNGQGYPLSFRLYNNTIIPAREVSQGLLLYFAFLTIVHRDDAPSVLLIEEPENGVHPLRLYEIVKLLRTLTERGVQIVLTTHSPDLLNACKPEEVLVFRRPNPDSGTEIRRLPPDFERKAMRSSMGEIWASSGEEGLLDILPKIEPSIVAEDR